MDPFGRTARDGQDAFCVKYGANRSGEKDCGGIFAGDVPGAGAAQLLALAPPAENKRTYAGTIYIDDNPVLSAADIYAKCCQLDNLGLVVIDYLQRMIRSRCAENRRQLAAETSRMLKIMAKELAVPVLCLGQLSRVTEEWENRRPIL